jgi:isocitrate/isopropylmalate dehydrogenase
MKERRSLLMRPGIGVEVIDAALDVLNAVQKHESDFKLDFHHYDYGCE